MSDCLTSHWFASTVPLVVLALWIGVAPEVRAQDPDPRRFADQIAAFAESDREDPPPEGAVLFVGSSSIRMWEQLDTDFPGATVVNRGFGGSHFSDLLHYLDELVLQYEPRLIFVYEGDNDVAAGKSARRVFEDFRTFVERVRSELPETHIGFVAVKPSPSRWEIADTMRAVNERIRSFTLWRPNLEFVDVFDPMLGNDGRPRSEIFLDDDLHMNRAGYRLWAKIVRPYVEAHTGD